jgi:hypothetical protein
MKTHLQWILERDGPVKFFFFLKKKNSSKCFWELCRLDEDLGESMNSEKYVWH